MKNKSVPLQVIILSALAFGLGYLILSQNRSETFYKSNGQQTTNNGEQATRTPSPETNVLIFPGDDAPQEVKDKHFQLVLEEAVGTDTVTIKNCQGDPVVAWVKNKSVLKIKNDDAQDHTLKVAVSEEYAYQLKSSANLDLKVEFVNGPGVYRYICDDPNVTAGIFYVVQGQ